MLKELQGRLVCSSCKGALTQVESFLLCHRCDAMYRIDRGYAMMLDDQLRHKSAEEWDVKAGEISDYTEIAKSLELTGVGRFATFLNFGYVANGNPQYAAITLDDYCLNRNSVKLLLEVVGDNVLRGLDIIDIGCGRGGNVSAMMNYYEPESVIGLDLCEANIAYCGARNRKSGVFFVVGDAEHVPYADESFDVVVNMESAHAYPNRGKFYEEVYRILRPGGIMLYSELMVMEDVERNVRMLREAGFAITRNQDVTSNVLLSCDENAKQRTGSQGIAGTAGADLNIPDIRDFIAVPGSPKYEDMKQGKRQYRILNLMKER
ncbi:ubiquinone/menaquinone biosynthesis C-methylase UbiE/uncharacterized protein YbaR (Trm112 family) [Paenibacillus phyllosphaerae]|uniref:Ubiquinone/menaquinone biosynthesis C-methylase UbiE/uncharacterized protein YbaR (Trm112 family) n=1 Tax=Paenibacillus phyllosphaerae TaxID=274593 RepID=A0A7W5B4M6_9BACL|nr:methyltransferase domain-containing protein [Paenibacillus phyllosphaerae]MBB3114182.1 ubiquinone/menaquinone biosynthesis C-methylase UbiE/uncharacterized protein YbaR (Trm112 family) [Paenibacillus phyllosphaerae]